MTTAITWAIDGTTTPATIARRMMAGLVGTAGIDATGALAVSERAAGANNSWDIAAGGVFLLDDGEVWHAWWDDTNISAPAADGTNSRIDLIVAELRADGTNDDAILRVIAGTPGSGSEPAVPDGAVVLARADVPAGVGSMVDGYLTDRRAPARLSQLLRDDGPRGVLDHAESTSDQTGVGSTEADLTGLTTTVDVGTGRKVRVRLYVHVQASDAAGVSEVRLRQSGNTAQATTHQHQAADLTGQHTHVLERTFTGLTGSHTFKGTMRRIGGTGTLDTNATSTQPAFILVEDLGPA